MKRDAVRQLRTELERAVARQAKGSRGRVRRALPLFGVLALGMTGAAVAVGSGVISSAPDAPDDPPIQARTMMTPPAPGSVRPLTPADLRAMRRERQRREPVRDARRYFSALSSRTSDTYHVIYDKPDGQIAIRASDREVCIQYRRRPNGGASGSCAPTADAGVYGVYVWEQCNKHAPHPQERIFAGVAPDGVSVVQGTRQGVVQASAKVINNAFVLLTDEPVDAITTGPTHRPMPPVAC